MKYEPASLTFKMTDQELIKIINEEKFLGTL